MLTAKTDMWEVHRIVGVILLIGMRLIVVVSFRFALVGRLCCVLVLVELCVF